MQYLHFFILFSLVLNLSMINVNAQENRPEQSENSFITLEVKVNGLDDVTQSYAATLRSLDAAILSIDMSMRELYANPEKLSVQQLQELTHLIAASESVIRTSQTFLSTTEQTLNEIQEPTAAIVEHAISETNTALVEPFIDKLIDEVTVWRYAFIGLLSLIIALLTLLIITSRNLVMLIAGQYRIVHVSKLSSSET